LVNKSIAVGYATSFDPSIPLHSNEYAISLPEDIFCKSSKTSNP